MHQRRGASNMRLDKVGIAQCLLYVHITISIPVLTLQNGKSPRKTAVQQFLHSASRNTGSSQDSREARRNQRLFSYEAPLSPRPFRDLR